mgnify:CR=1 FL=1
MPSPQVGHLHVSDVVICRESDKMWFRFKTYRLRHGEWGYDLRYANGQPADMVSDPDWPGPDAVREWLEDNIESFDRVPGLGWCSHVREVPLASNGKAATTPGPAPRP